jgi:hypothetical protein
MKWFSVLLMAILAFTTSPAFARHHYYQTTEESIGAVVAHTAEVGTQVAVDSTNAALTFCERIGRSTTEHQVDFDSDSHFETRIESNNSRGTYYFFGPPVEKRIDAGSYTRSNVRMTCSTKPKDEPKK